jgi:S-adenosylmethionine:tRNA ribosyltransferase-isomerase
MSDDIQMLDAYQFDLPQNLIAQQAHDPADECKLMCIDCNTWSIDHRIFLDMVKELTTDSVLIFNNSKVIKARILIDIGGKQGELFFIKYIGQGISEFLVRPGKKFPVWSVIYIGPHMAKVVAHTKHGRLVFMDTDIYDILEQYGQMPLPPYITYDENKVADYQPYFAQQPWSVASPTASLHFTSRAIWQLQTKWIQMEHITLHVGLGTFKWVDVTNIKDYDIHPEVVEIQIWLLEKIASYHQQKKRIIGVWTTVCRTLETLPYMYYLLQDQIKDQLSPNAISYRNRISHTIDLSKQYCINPMIVENHIEFQTKLYITPWFHIHIVNELITNFHIPASSLLILVSSIMGYDLMKKAYHTAIAQQYRFYSFGDAMWIKNIPVVL